MSEHARLSASASSRWINCPGSLAMEESLPKRKEVSSKYAAEGTCAHWVASEALISGKRCWTFIDDTDPDGYTVDSEMVVEVQKYVDKVLEYSNGHTLLVEQRVDYSTAIGVPDSFGTSDAIILTVDGKEIIIVDLKYGRGVAVSAEENEQLLLYALGALETLDLLVDLSHIERVRLVIHQPRIGSLSEWDCDLEYLEAFRLRAKDAATKAIATVNLLGYKRLPAHAVPSIFADTLAPSEDACRWCKAASICPALRVDIAKAVFDATPVTADEFSSLDEVVVVDKSVNMLERAQWLGASMDKIDMIEGWCKAVRASVESELLVGAAVPGYKLVEGKKGNRQWSDETAVTDLLKSFRLKTAQMYDMKLITPSKAHELFKTEPKRLKKLARLVTQAKGKASVAPASDARPALYVKPVSEDFAPLDGNTQGEVNQPLI